MDPDTKAPALLAADQADRRIRLFNPFAAGERKPSLWAKSASQHIDGTLWVTDPAELEGAASWHSDSILRVRPAEPPIRHRNVGSRFYKARWWQKVPFSY